MSEYKLGPRNDGSSSYEYGFEDGVLSKEWSCSEASYNLHLKSLKAKIEELKSIQSTQSYNLNNLNKEYMVDQAKIKNLEKENAALTQQCEQLAGALDSLLNKVNKVTSDYRHKGYPHAISDADLIELCNRQIEVESSLIAYRKFKGEGE